MNQIFAQLFYEMEKHRDTVLVTLIDTAGSAPEERFPDAGGCQRPAHRYHRRRRRGAPQRGDGHGPAEEKRSAVHDFLLHTAASGGDISMVCGGDVTAHFQFIPAEDASWQALASA